MSSRTGPSIPTANLTTCLDAANRKSFINAAGSQASIIDMSTWNVGTGGCTNFNPNQTTSTENQRLLTTDPWNGTSVIWQSNPSGDGNGDGGWEGTFSTVDTTKTYRFTVWIKRTSSTSGGNFYHGLHTNSGSDVLDLSTGASNTNPYWEAVGTSAFTQNQWYLSVGHIFPVGYTGTTAHPDSGRWNQGLKVSSNSGITDCKFPADATALYMRVYHYYCGDTTTHLQFSSPRIDLVDGTQPTISELFNTGPTVITDISKNLQTVGGFIPNNSTPTYNKGYNGQFIFNNACLQSGQFVDGFASDSQYTRTVWMMPTAYGNDFKPVFCNLIGNNADMAVCIDSLGRAAFHQYTSTNDYTLSGTTVMTLDVWYMVTVTVDRTISTNNIKVYLNANLEGTGSQTIGESASNTICIGGAGTDAYAGARRYFGSIGVVLHHSRILSSDEISQTFNALRGRYGI